MLSRRSYEIFGLACGFVLIDYGFSFIAAGLPGARALTGQFVGANLIVGGSAAVFLSLYYLLRPGVTTQPASTSAPHQLSSAPDVGVETIVEEEGPPKSNFYRNIAYTGYFFTILGLISAAHLVLQVFIPALYNEVLWWVEILLVVFGVLAYTIFGSVGHLGSQEEAKLPVHLTQSNLGPLNVARVEAPSTPSVQLHTEPLEVRVKDFAKSPAGEYERKLSGEVYDAFRIDRNLITIWREDRKGMRSVYLAGPYELSRALLEEHSKSGEELNIGSLRLTVDSIRELLALQNRPVESAASPVR